MDNKSLTSDENLFDFFHERVDWAAANCDIDVSEEGIFYLTNLLVERGSGMTPQPVPTLAELHFSARSGNRIDAIQSYRSLGDNALYTTGFFRGSLQRKAVSLAYYFNMGSAAYDVLSNLLSEPHSMVVTDANASQGHKSLDAIFSELAFYFEQCSEVLREVQEELRAHAINESKDTDILALYEEWMSTGSEAAAKRLRELGVMPVALGQTESC
jgi:hypothetical protein